MNIVDSVKEFLLLLSDPTDEDLPETFAIIELGKTYLNRWHNFLGSKFTQLESLKGELDTLMCSGGDNDTSQIYIWANTGEYNQKCRQIKLANIYTNLLKLEECKSYSDMSELLKLFLNLQLNFGPGNLKLKKIFIEKVNRIKNIHLNRFHCKFESHLRSTFMGNIPPSVADELWEKFISGSREDLTAFFALSMLPQVVFEPNSASVERYKESLETALAPMWSRFYHHLLIVRDIGTVDQFTWSFGYSRSFVVLLTSLLQAFDKDSLMMEYLPQNYFRSSQHLIVHKTVNFMRAHIAVLISRLPNPLPDGLCCQVIELILSLNKYLSELSDDSGGVFSVVLDAKLLYQQWVQIEVQYFHVQLKSVVSADCAFSAAYMGNPFFHSSTQCHPRCVFGVYEFIRLLSLSMLRYECLPETCKSLLSWRVLEPLILVSVGFILVLIKSDPMLRLISDSSIISGVIEAEKLSTSIECVVDSVSYFKESITWMATSLTGNRSRYLRNWASLHNWILKKQNSSQKVDLVEMIGFVFSLHDVAVCALELESPCSLQSIAQLGVTQLETMSMILRTNSQSVVKN